MNEQEEKLVSRTELASKGYTNKDVRLLDVTGIDAKPDISNLRTWVTAKDNGDFLIYLDAGNEWCTVLYESISEDKKETCDIAKENAININGPLQIFVDGSYNKDNNLTGAGIVILHGDKIYKKAFLVPTEDDHSWNIDGECYATLEALKICSGISTIENTKIEAKEIVINYDYMGIEKWATQEWKAKSKIARLYSEEFNELVSKNGLDVKFNKVKAHSGDQYNEIADGLAYSITTSQKKK